MWGPHYAAWLLIVLAGTALVPTPTAAQSLGFDAESFNAAPGRANSYQSVASPRPMGPGVWELAAIGTLADDLLVQDDANGDRLRSIIHRQGTLDIQGIIGIGPHLDFALSLPVMAFREGTATTEFGDPTGFSLADLRVQGRVGLLPWSVDDDGPWALGLIAGTALPTGDRDGLTSNGLTAHTRLALEYGRQGDVRVAANVGYDYVQEPGSLDNLVFGDTFGWGIAADLPVSSVVHIVPEVVGSFPADQARVDANHTTAEARLGAKLFFENGAALECALGSGLVPGAGSPDWRAVAGLSFGGAPNPDRDGDGILNRPDECPDDPEDFDGFEDEDGCPDPDNDQDGILDTPDACPDDPEDFDAFEDEDGCPDLDNDEDLILDVDDACPDVPEDFDGFEDADGCPEADNDEDGYLDPDDGCPNFPEDFDGFEDEDGCPDADNDEDGILDVEDECPDEPEVLNDIDDEDGCPDEGGEFELTCDGVELDTIYFVFDSAEIQEASLPTLDRVASILRNAPYINRMRIEGHTDSQGPADYNLELSAARAEAVVAYLISRGIVPERLSFEGFGETRPISSENTWQGRYHNRRVGFIIIDQDRCREER